MENTTKPMLDQGESILAALRATHRQYGLQRIQLGVLLTEVRRLDLWKGRASSFGAFLEESRINDSAAYQYMRVAKVFFYDLELSDDHFAELASVNMTTLDLACKVINKENKDEIFSILTALGEKDARSVLEEMLDEATKPPQSNRGRRLRRLIDLYRDLPEDDRVDFRIALNGKRPGGPAAANGRDDVAK